MPAKMIANLASTKPFWPPFLFTIVHYIAKKRLCELDV